MTTFLRPWSEAPRAQLAGIRGVFTDIDDTLTTDGAITPDALAALQTLQDAGIAVVAVTGRPVGWSEPFVFGPQPWPVDAIVAENGAVLLSSVRFRLENASMSSTGGDSLLSKSYLSSWDERAANFERMQAILAEIERELPPARRATDSPGRETDIAIDHSEFCRLTPALVAQVVARMQGHGLVATVSSIHINAWFGRHNKLVGAHWAVRALYGRELGQELDSWVYVGDSTNDQLMFEGVPLSVGVANVARFVPNLTHLPRFVTLGERGVGFAQVAAAVLAARG